MSDLSASSASSASSAISLDQTNDTITEESVFPQLALQSDEDTSSDDSDVETNPLRLPSRVRRAEAILSHRTERVIVVLEQMVDSMNHQAVLRTCEALGVQHIWCIDNAYRKTYTIKGGLQVSAPLVAGTTRWLSIRVFETQAECIEALKADSRTIWSTYLGEGAQPLTRQAFSNNATGKPMVPDRLAIIIGRELDGVSHEMLAASDLHIYLPQWGFCESLNVSVATALVLHTVLDWCPEMRGDLNKDDKNAIRRRWFRKLAPRDYLREEYEACATLLEQAYEDPNKSEAVTKQLQWNQQSTRCNEAIRIPRMSKKLRDKVVAQGLRPVVLEKIALPVKVVDVTQSSNQQ